MGQLFGGSVPSAQAGQSNETMNNLYSMFSTGILPQLTNFGAQQQPEVQQLSNTLDASNKSLVDTQASRMGGIANPALALKGMATTGAQTGMQATQGMESQMVGQILQALGIGTGGIGTIGAASGSNANANAGLAGATQANNANMISSGIGSLFGGGGKGAGAGGAAAGASAFGGSATGLADLVSGAGV